VSHKGLSRRRATPITASSLFALGLCACLQLSPAARADVDHPRLNLWPGAAPSPDFHLRDERGTARTLQSFRGYVTVVTFGYANCPGMCSLQLQKLAAAVHALGTQRDAVRVVFVTLDPARDTPAALAHFVGAFDPAFIALRGTAAQTDEASKRFSVEYARLPGKDKDYLIDHPIEEFVFDRTGQLRLVGGSEATADDLTHDLSLLVKDSRAAPQ
jgi:protein SCO1